ncbi:hypothetical protein P3S67_007322 [Capsicum chacoense]
MTRDSQSAYMSFTLNREMDVLSIPTSLTITTLAIILAACVFKLVFNDSANKGKYHPVAGTTMDHLLNFNRLYDYMTEMATKVQDLQDT